MLRPPIGNVVRATLVVALTAVCLSACSSADAPELTEEQAYVESLIVDENERGLQISEPIEGETRWLDTLQAWSALEAVGVPVIAEPRSPGGHDEIAKQILGGRDAATYAGVVIAAPKIREIGQGLRSSLVEELSARLVGLVESKDEVDPWQAYLLVSALVALDASVPDCPRRAVELELPAEVAASMSAQLRTLGLAACAHVPRVTATADAAQKPTQETVTEIRLFARTLASRGSGRLSDYETLLFGADGLGPTAPLPVLAATLIACGQHCDLGAHRTAVLRKLQLIVTSRGSAADLVEQAGFSQFAAGALIDLLDYPASHPLHGVRAWSQAPWPQAPSNVEASNALIEGLRNPALTLPDIPEEVIRTAASVPGSMGAVHHRFDTCDGPPDAWTRAVRGLEEAAAFDRLTPIRRIGVALDLTAVQDCGQPLDASTRESLVAVIERSGELAAADESSAEDEQVYERWSTQQARCVLGASDDAERAEDAEAARAYLSHTRGDRFAEAFSIHGAFAAHALIDGEKDCSRAPVWWRAPVTK